MEIVINMPEEAFESVKRYYEQNQECYALCAYVASGTPLPKGHGRLIDADDIALIDEQFYVPSDYYVAESAINDAPTIIEAYKE